MGADDTVSSLNGSSELRGRAPRMIRLRQRARVRLAIAGRDWCRFNNAGTGYIEPGAAWQIRSSESFNGQPPRELLEMESFNSLSKHSSCSTTGGSSTTITDPPITQLHDTREYARR